MQTDSALEPRALHEAWLRAAAWLLMCASLATLWMPARAQTPAAGAGPIVAEYTQTYGLSRPDPLNPPPENRLREQTEIDLYRQLQALDKSSADPAQVALRRAQTQVYLAVLEALRREQVLRQALQQYALRAQGELITTALDAERTIAAIEPK